MPGLYKHSAGAWCGHNVGDWIQVDLGQKYIVTKISLQGRPVCCICDICSITFTEEILNENFLYSVGDRYVFVETNCVYPYFSIAVASATELNHFFRKVILFNWRPVSLLVLMNN